MRFDVTTCISLHLGAGAWPAVPPRASPSPARRVLGDTVGSTAARLAGLGTGVYGSRGEGICPLGGRASADTYAKAFGERPRNGCPLSYRSRSGTIRNLAHAALLRVRPILGGAPQVLAPARIDAVEHGVESG
jgi:hypothetical protein